MGRRRFVGVTSRVFRPRTLTEQCVDERRGLERRKIVGTLAQPDEFDGHTQVLLHAEHDSALGRAVELVSTTPVMFTTSANTRACGRLF